MMKGYTYRVSVNAPLCTRMTYLPAGCVWKFAGLGTTSEKEIHRES